MNKMFSICQTHWFDSGSYRSLLGFLMYLQKLMTGNVSCTAISEIIDNTIYIHTRVQCTIVHWPGHTKSTCSVILRGSGTRANRFLWKANYLSVIFYISSQFLFVCTLSLLVLTFSPFGHFESINSTHFGFIFSTTSISRHSWYHLQHFIFLIRTSTVVF